MKCNGKSHANPESTLLKIFYFKRHYKNFLLAGFRKWVQVGCSSPRQKLAILAKNGWIFAKNCPLNPMSLPPPPRNLKIFQVSPLREVPC